MIEADGEKRLKWFTACLKTYIYKFYVWLGVFMNLKVIKSTILTDKEKQELTALKEIKKRANWVISWCRLKKLGTDCCKCGLGTLML